MQSSEIEIGLRLPKLHCQLTTKVGDLPSTAAPAKYDFPKLRKRKQKFRHTHTHMYLHNLIGLLATHMARLQPTMAVEFYNGSRVLLQVFDAGVALGRARLINIFTLPPTTMQNG